MLKSLLSFLLFASLCVTSFAQAVSGTVTDEQGNPLAFATVYVQDMRMGTAANADGEYTIEVSSGAHLFRFQYLGYRTQEKRVTVSGEAVRLDVQMPVEPVQLTDVTVFSDREDPAYTIMRKAIAKAKFHTQQLDGYKATAYIKGSGRLKGLPGLFRKTIERELEKEGVDTSTAFTSESVSEITYTRPNQYEERVISVRKIGDDMNTDPIGFIQSSFYEPSINGAVSPLAPRAFAYYKFEYLGEFADQGHTIDKIRVIPRSKGDNLFSGTLYIVDQEWSIHSLDLDTYIWGIKFNIQQIYHPVVEHVWMPLNQIFNINGAVIGFKFEFQYFANLSDYAVTLNPDLDFVPDLIDDKLEPEAAKAADAELSKKENEDVLSQLSSGEEVSRKQLKKLLKDYEKEEENEWAQDTLEDVTGVYNQVVDTMAYKRDSVYWTKIRPIPLTGFEVKGYQVQDSIAKERAAEEAAKQDSIEFTVGSQDDVGVKARSHFSVFDILTGGSYALSDNTRLKLEPLLAGAGFNTVDGYAMAFGLGLSSRINDKVSLSIDPKIRYAFARDVLNYKLRARIGGGDRENRWGFIGEGGWYTVQINSDNPIHPLVNGVMSVLFEQNYMKLYEKSFGQLGFQKNFGREYSASVTAEWAMNHELRNHSDFSLFDSKKREYTPNAPANATIGVGSFPDHESFIWTFKGSGTPWLKYVIRNGKKQVIQNSSPEFSFQYRVGLKDVFGSDVGFHHVEAGFQHTLTFAAGGILNFNVNGGGFLGKSVTDGSRGIYFPHWKHFPGNRTPFATLDPAKSFRMLDYYLYSTRDEYVTLFANYQFRKLLATQVFEVRLAGIRESVFINALETPDSDHYFELGYGLNYIFRIFRLEFVTAWQDFQYQDFAVRIGIAANLNNIFN